jgi:hypothetical protein
MSSSRQGSPLGDTTRSAKVKESDFSPTIREIAVAAKSYIRTTTVYLDTFPSTKGTARLEFAWATIMEVAKKSKNTAWMTALSHLKQTQEMKKKLITFVSFIAFLSHMLTFNI